MKEPYIWNYNIKVKTQDGEYEYERETLEIKATQNKPKSLQKKRGGINDTFRSSRATKKTRK